MKFVCYGPQHSAQESDEALADLEGLSWQVVTIFYSFSWISAAISLFLDAMGPSLLLINNSF